MRYKSLFVIALFVSLIAVVIAGVAPRSASALSGSEFVAGRIIDDSIFFNSAAMPVTDIQSFLNAKVPTCDTNGTQPYGGTTRAAYGTSQGYPPPYTCLKDYRQDTVAKSAEAGLCNGYGVSNQSAAEIIYGVAQSCGISPKVLIVLLQKEQSLVTDDWPWSIQYRSATGYGCPDTAPCDTQYYGFFNQVYAAARGYKYYAQHPTEFNYRAGRDNFILFNPNSACGGSTVFIQNQATANLYIYTPYQPNQAALDNLYGSGDGCSAYGNRNFWRLYRDWFGNTTGPGYEFVSSIGPTAQILPNDVINVNVVIRNRSGTTWYSDGNVPSGQHPLRLSMLGYQNTPFANPSDPAWLGTSNQIKMKETSVADGQTATFEFTLRGPLQQIASTDIKFTPVLDGVGFYPSIGMAWSSSTPQPDYSYQVISTSGLTGSLPTNYSRAVSINIKNTGNVVWFNETSRPAGAAPVRLATVNPYYHASVFYDSSSWIANNQIVSSTSKVTPGYAATFNFNLKTPASSGDYADDLGLVLDGRTFFPNNPPIHLSVRVADYDFSVISTDIPSSMQAGQKYTATITLKNTGYATWYADGNTPPNTYPIRLMTSGYQKHPFADTSDPAWLGTTSQIKMTTLSVNAGENAEFKFNIIAPYDSSGYTTNLRLVLDGVSIFSGAIQKSTSIPSKQFSYDAITGTINPPLTMQSGQTFSARLVVRNQTNFVWYNEGNRPSNARGGTVRMVMTNPFYRNSPFADITDPAWLGTRNQVQMITAIVNPGESGVFDFTWKAPTTKGTYHERFALVLDGYSLFPDIGMEFATTVQ